MKQVLSPSLAASFARIALGHVTREYPHKADHVMASEVDVYTPRQVHPIFYGSFDWHSCVHGYWLLARVRRRFPALPEVQAIDELFADAFSPSKVEAERRYLDRPASRGFERPYGWAWLLMLAAELEQSESVHAVALEPLTAAFVERFHDYLQVLTYPLQSGNHANTAFAMVLAHRYASVAQDPRLQTALEQRARTWFMNDRIVDIREPGGEDFLSPALMEALVMRRVLPTQEIGPWVESFIPGLLKDPACPLLIPPSVSDRSDGKIAHLDGLSLSRAWALTELADVRALERERLLGAASRHLDAALSHLDGDYMGEHWLSTFALLALDGLD